MGEPNNPQGEVTTPGGKEGQTPETTKTLTPEVEALISKANAALTNYGRLEAEFKRSQSVAQAALTRLKEMDEEKYREQEEVNKDNPDELSRIRRRRQDTEREAKLAERETKIKTQLDRVLQTTAKSLSIQYNVSLENLLKYGGEDAESMEELVKSYGERKGESEKIRMKEPPDEGKTKGGGAGLTVEDVKKMSPDEQNRRREEISKLSFV